jgi:mRNA interferase MazF
MVTKARAVAAKTLPRVAARSWVPDRGDIIWIDCNPQAGREMRDMHPMAVLSPKAFNARTGIVIGLPMTSSTSNEGNPFALDVSRSATERSFVLCHQPKSFDWRQRRAAPHPWKKLSLHQLADCCDGLNDIITLAST